MASKHFTVRLTQEKATELRDDITESLKFKNGVTIVVEKEKDNITIVTMPNP